MSTIVKQIPNKIHSFTTLSLIISSTASLGFELRNIIEHYACCYDHSLAMRSSVMFYQQSIVSKREAHLNRDLPQLDALLVNHIFPWSAEMCVSQCDTPVACTYVCLLFLASLSMSSYFLFVSISIWSA